MEFHDDDLIEPLIMALEDLGAILVETSDERGCIKFEIPLGCEADKQDHLRSVAAILKRIDGGKYKLMVKRIKPPTPVAYEDNINKLIYDVANDVLGIPLECNRVSVRNTILRRSNITMQQLSDMMMDGLIVGYSIDDQCDMIRKVLKEKYG